MKENKVSQASHPLHRRALAAAANFKQAEASLIDALIEVERARIFIELGYASLFVYAVQALGLSEAIAYSAITVARKAREVPALQEELRAGRIGISKCKKIATVLKPENQGEWLLKARTLSSRALEREVATASPRTETPERARYVSGKRIELTLGVDESVMLEFRKVQDQVSRTLGKAATLEETLARALAFYRKHKDPVEKAKRVIAKKGVGNPTEAVKIQFPGTFRFLASRTGRTPIPAAVAHAVRLRDQGQCQQPRADGAHCGERRFVDLHHRVPVAQGGANSVANLVTLCRVHHQAQHRNQGLGITIKARGPT